MGELTLDIVWFDSLGAKSSSILVKTPDISILIDPGAAEMQPGFPASKAKKRRWLREARTRIRNAARKADIIVISHYHYDHFTDFDRDIYRGKLILAKNPNEYINDSQRKRAERFYERLSKQFGNLELEKLMKPREKPKDYPDPLDDLPLARSREYGEYGGRKRELLEKGRRWFMERARRWNGLKLIPELRFDECAVKFIDGKALRFGKTWIRFTKPAFHGIEYARVGWVVSVVIEREGEKLIHTSDLEGPVIEDQAEWIIEENPDILIVDGPSTYLIPYMLNLINLGRAVENMRRIIKETETDLIIYDHHLTREPRFMERVKPVYKEAEKMGKPVLTAAEYLGKKPAIMEAD